MVKWGGATGPAVDAHQSLERGRDYAVLNAGVQVLNGSAKGYEREVAQLLQAVAAKPSDPMRSARPQISFWSGITAGLHAPPPRDVANGAELDPPRFQIDFSHTLVGAYGEAVY